MVEIKPGSVCFITQKIQDIEQVTPKVTLIGAMTFVYLYIPIQVSCIVCILFIVLFVYIYILLY
jgi:hypothetical protein